MRSLSGKDFLLCLEKTGNEHDADELASNISFEILSSLGKGTVPKSFDAWVRTIAKNQYARWAKSRYYSPLSDALDITEYETLADKMPSPEENAILSEELSLVRRELAFIRSDYRNILIAHYFEEKSVSMIANEFQIPLGTVKTKLIHSRKQLKEGMNMARTFGKRSYKPEQISFVMSGKTGQQGQPWSIITHLLYKNIFLETYENPLTAEELSLEFGIALPYMEDELAFLVREQLLRKDGNRYQTDFPIISKEEQHREFETNKKIQKPLTDKICELIDTYMREDGAKVDVSHIGYENAKWALICRVFDCLKWDTVGDDRDYNYPNRPDGGAWTLKGYEDIDWQKPYFVGQHGYISHDEAEVKMDIDFSQFKFRYQNIQAKTPLHLNWKEVYTLWLACTGHMEACDKNYLEKLIEYGYLKKDGSPNLVIFDKNAEKPGNEALTQKLISLRKEILCLFKKVPKIERGYIVEQALADGWLVYDENTISSIGAYIYI
ncbi:MAG: RNA polymerase sigma factor [Clostridia bacterium]|nr:RNA polymerase sigma factor [Clostridia bacterium]